MGNDIGMLNDIEAFEKQGEFGIANGLTECLNAKFKEKNDKEAELLKKQFREKHNWWEDYY